MKTPSTFNRVYRLDYFYLLQIKKNFFLQTMGENPTEMHRHVISTMLNHSQCYTIFGPLFYQIKQAMHPYWSQPPSLKYICRSTIRNSIINVPGRFINEENVSSLKLPPSLQSYLMLESWVFFSLFRMTNKINKRKLNTESQLNGKNIFKSIHVREKCYTHNRYYNKLLL